MSIRKPKETDLRNTCLAYLRDVRGWVAFKNNTGATKVGNRFVRFGEPGSGDILGLIPPHGRFLSIETKMPGRHPTVKQKAWAEAVRASGGIALFIYSLQDLIDALAREGY